MKSDGVNLGNGDRMEPSTTPWRSPVASDGKDVRLPAPEDPASSFFFTAIERNLEILRTMGPRVPDGDDPEIIHDVRVAIRRIRACISLRTPDAAQKRASAIDRKLRGLFRMLGEVRDLDVLLASVYTYSKRLGIRRAKEFVAFVNDCEIRRSKALSRVISAFSPPAFEASLGAFSELPVMYRESGEPAFRAVPALLDAPVLIAGTYRALLAFDPMLKTGATPDETYHAARRAAKRHRYSIEFFSGMLGPGAERCHGTVKALQDHLGSMNDTFSAIRRVMSFLSRSMAAGGDGQYPGDHPPGPEVTRYLALRQTESRRLAAGFTHVWKRVSSPTFRRTLFTALGAIPKTR
jgi:CHAD domain-containing protein